MKITGKYAQSEDTLHSFAEGELAVTVTDPDPAAKRLKLTIERTDDNGDPVKVGDTLTYRITYENVGTQSFAVYPRESNLDGVTDPAVGEPTPRPYAGGAGWIRERPVHAPAATANSSPTTR